MVRVRVGRRGVSAVDLEDLSPSVVGAISGRDGRCTADLGRGAVLGRRAAGSTRGALRSVGLCLGHAVRGRGTGLGAPIGVDPRRLRAWARRSGGARGARRGLGGPGVERNRGACAGLGRARRVARGAGRDERGESEHRRERAHGGPRISRSRAGGRGRLSSALASARWGRGRRRSRCRRLGLSGAREGALGSSRGRRGRSRRASGRG